MNILQFDVLNCRNCYKCVRHCPVKAIEIKDHRAQIIKEECILCGECTIVCPQKNKEPISEIQAVAGELAGKQTLIASVAPSFSAYFRVSFNAFRAALLKLGFSDACETAEGAYLVKTAYEKLISENHDKVFISSCCSSVNQLINKYYPEALPCLAPVLTPVQAHAKMLKERDGEAKLVFIAPCISKKSERYSENTQIDYVLSFEEIEDMLAQRGIDLKEPEGADEDSFLSRWFPTDGGIVKTLKKQPGYHYSAISGYTNCVQALEAVKSGDIKSCFIEMSLCSGSCIGGPSFRKRNIPIISADLQIRRNIRAEAYSRDYNIKYKNPLTNYFSSTGRVIRVLPSEEQIEATFRKMGKFSEKDELNCGMCGYSSCREKAIAVIAGKAEITMCLPYMHERAESISNQIISITPNGIISVDSDLRIQQINEAACSIFRVLPEDVLKQPISRIMDEFMFVEMITNSIERSDRTSFLPEYGVYLEQVILFNKESGMFVSVMKDISKERQKKNTAMKKKIQAAAMADEIADKQLRIVHEIASLLGETAAETKMAIHDLKGTIMMEDGD